MTESVQEFAQVTGGKPPPEAARDDHPGVEILRNRPPTFAECLSEANFCDPDRWLSTPESLHLALGRTPGRVQTLNLTHLRWLFSDPNFRTAVRHADYLCADGWPVVLLARRLGVDCRRVTGSGFLFDLVAGHTADVGRRVALIGSDAGAAEMLLTGLRERHAELVYAEHGRWHDWDARLLATYLSDRQVDLVLVAVSPPNGEVVAAAIARHLPHCAVVGIGGAVDMLAGHVRRAPALWQRLGMEWAWRALQEPSRMVRRYLAQDLPFMIKRLVPVLARPDSVARPPYSGTPGRAWAPYRAPGPSAVSSSSRKNRRERMRLGPLR